ncbi:MAG: hypothetical protein JSV80_03345 [Acidobacteriota bacterium]|nr:MAG: hypothetical protein JSV80_03345 [Acidobacteriota bacterium]
MLLTDALRFPFSIGSDVLVAGEQSGYLDFGFIGLHFDIPTVDDTDRDGVVDFLDSAPLDPTIFAFPCEVKHPFVELDTTVSWDPIDAGSGTTYELLHDPVGLPGKVAGWSASWFGLTSPSLLDDEVPLPGVAWSYVARARNSSGVGTLGYDFEGCERTDPF